MSVPPKAWIFWARLRAHTRAHAPLQGRLHLLLMRTAPNLFEGLVKGEEALHSLLARRLPLPGGAVGPEPRPEAPHLGAS